jgi:hypothetical protein
MLSNQAIQPNLLVIGAQKGGSTWLYHVLKQHPDIFMSEVKELSFFNKELQTEKNISRYLENFSQGAQYQYCGEATPGYFAIPDARRDVPQNAYDLLGSDARLVLSLRDPVDRAVSAYFHHFRAGRIDPSKTMRDQAHIGDILNFGHYKICYEHWVRVFRPEVFFVTAFERIGANGQKIASELYKWLGLADHINLDANTRHNFGFERAIIDGNLQVIKDSSNPLNRRLWAGQLRADPALGSVCITQEDIDWLGEIFADDIAFVEKSLLKSDLGWGAKPLDFYQ